MGTIQILKGACGLYAFSLGFPKLPWMDDIEALFSKHLMTKEIIHVEKQPMGAKLIIRHLRQQNVIHLSFSVVK